MPGFLVFFNEKEGTSHLMELLRGFTGLSVIGTGPQGYLEPFDRHQCGDMPTRDLVKCLDLIFDATIDRQRLDGIYTRTAMAPLARITPGSIPGFKMRYAPPADRDNVLSRAVTAMPVFGRRLAGILNLGRRRYQRDLIAVLSRREVTVFFAVRQDIFRWALSKYHGDGTGNDGHLQFEIATGARDSADVPAIHVERRQFKELLATCRSIATDKIRLMHRMQQSGIGVVPLYYEELCDNPYRFLAAMLSHLRLEVSDEEIQAVLAKGSTYEKVHSNDISTFVINHAEISNEFGHCFFDLENEYASRYGSPPWPAAR